jgi:hypothetical protein
MLIVLHAATQAIRFRPGGTSLITYTMRVTLWTTTAIHLDTPMRKPDTNRFTHKPLTDPRLHPEY